MGYMGYTQLGLFDPPDRWTLKTKEGTITFRMRANNRIKRGRLLVTPEEGLIVETPRQATVRRAKKMINRRKSWVLDALEGIREKHRRAQEVKKHRHSVLVFGKEKFLRIKAGQSRAFALETERMIYFGFEEGRVTKAMLKERLVSWLHQRADDYLPLRVRRLNQARFNYKNVFIKDQQTLWGSCSNQGNLNLNWRLIMAPQEMSDYIILHELCHTRYLNHSRPYWHLVEQLYPRYEKAEAWFKDYGFLLNMAA